MTIAVLDACVLYPPSLRDLLLWLAALRVYEPRWTEDIHTEWIRNVLADNPDIIPAQLERTRLLMDQVTPYCLVTGYEKRIPSLSLPDESDRHVLATAIEASAALIVTFNLADFPAATLQTYGIQPVHPDDFLCALFDDEPELFLRGLQAHRTSLRRPPKTAEEYLATLRANGLKSLAMRIEAYTAAI